MKKKWDWIKYVATTKEIEELKKRGEIVEGRETIVLKNLPVKRGKMSKMLKKEIGTQLLLLELSKIFRGKEK